MSSPAVGHIPTTPGQNDVPNIGSSNVVHLTESSGSDDDDDDSRESTRKKRHSHDHNNDDDDDDDERKDKDGDNDSDGDSESESGENDDDDEDDDDKRRHHKLSKNRQRRPPPHLVIDRPDNELFQCEQERIQCYKDRPLVTYTEKGLTAWCPPVERGRASRYKHRQIKTTQFDSNTHDEYDQLSDNLFKHYSAFPSPDCNFPCLQQYEDCHASIATICQSNLNAVVQRSALNCDGQLGNSYQTLAFVMFVLAAIVLFCMTLRRMCNSITSHSTILFYFSHMLGVICGAVFVSTHYEFAAMIVRVLWALTFAGIFEIIIADRWLERRRCGAGLCLTLLLRIMLCLTTAAIALFSYTNDTMTDILTFLPSLILAIYLLGLMCGVCANSAREPAKPTGFLQQKQHEEIRHFALKELFIGAIAVTLVMIDRYACNKITRYFLGISIPFTTYFFIEMYNYVAYLMARSSTTAKSDWNNSVNIVKFNHGFSSCHTVVSATRSDDEDVGAEGVEIQTASIAMCSVDSGKKATLAVK
jgi:hypothetical protein